MDLDPTYLFLSLVTGAIGLGAFTYGKRLQEGKPLLIGLLLMLASYFATSTLSLLAVSTVLIAWLSSNQIQARLEGRGKEKPRIQSIHRR